MDKDKEEVEKLKQLLNRHQVEDNIQLEYGDFVDFAPEDEELEDNSEVSDDETLHIEDEIEATEELLASENVPTDILTEEEQKLIDSCPDPDFKRLLILNRIRNNNLLQLHRKLRTFLTECRTGRSRQRSLIKQVETNFHKNSSYSTWKLSAPYFKTERFFGAPPNDDFIRKRANNELSIADFQRCKKWTALECETLNDAVIFNYNFNRQDTLKRAILNLKAKLASKTKDAKAQTEESKDEIRDRLKKLEEEYETLCQNDKQIPEINSNEFINWGRISERFFDGKRLAPECKAMWHIYLHPSINKSPWTSNENTKLERLARKYENQNWDRIANELGGNRNAFTVCLHFYRDITTNNGPKKFSAEEDKRLLAAINIYKNGTYIPWKKVSSYVGSRNSIQVYHRYTYFLADKDDIRKGRFTDTEDILLLILVNRFGKNFRKVSEYMLGRSQMQLRSRYITNLELIPRKGCFTVSDDMAIMSHVEENGEKDWGFLINKLNRCRGSLRQRYLVIKNFLEANPCANISNVPRRKHTMNNQRVAMLQLIADKFKDQPLPSLMTIQTLVNHEKDFCVDEPPALEVRTEENKKTNTPKGCSYIDNMLVEFFGEAIKYKQLKYFSAKQVEDAVNNVMEVLTCLEVKLEIPKNIEKDSRLDVLDKKILSRISEMKSAPKNKSFGLIPPNINTLIGLRSLLIRNMSYKEAIKKNSRGHENIMWSIERNLLRMHDYSRDAITSDRKIFSNRFNILFTWSSILSMEQPDFKNNMNLKENRISMSDQVPCCSKTINASEEPQKLIRVYQRKRPAAPVVLSVKKSKIDISLANEKVAEQSVTEASAKDLNDIEKLDALLKSEGQSVNVDDEDEYEQCKSEVEILNEILAKQSGSPS